MKPRDKLIAVGFAFSTVFTVLLIFCVISLVRENNEFYGRVSSQVLRIEREIQALNVNLLNVTQQVNAILN